MKKTLLLFFAFTWCFSASSQVGVTTYDPETEASYTLFSELFGNNSYLIDNCGRLINEWNPTGGNGLSSALLPNGNLVRGVKTSGSTITQPSTGGAIEIRNWDDEPIWFYKESDTNFIQHHDFIIMPNGNILFLGWENIWIPEQLALGKDSSLVTNPALWGEYIKEVKPDGQNGEVVWEWHQKYHFVQDINETSDNYGVISESPHKLDINLPLHPLQFSLVDPYHANAIDYNPVRDEIVINMRSIGELWIIDHSTTTEEAMTDSGGNSGLGGSILYRWGNPEVYQQEESDSDWKLFGSHGTNFVDEGHPDEGKIIFFNNGVLRPDGSYSTIEIIEPDLDDQGNYYLNENSQFATKEHKVVYGSDKSLSSDFISNAHQLANGNIFINEGENSRLLEVDQEENILWEYQIPLLNGFPINQSSSNNNFLCFKAFKYPIDYFTNEELDLSPGDFIELNVETNFCDLVSVEEEALSYELKRYQDRIEINLPIQKNKMNLISINGQVIDFNHSILTNYTTIDLSSLHSGIYILNFEDSEGNSSQYKFAVMR